MARNPEKAEVNVFLNDHQAGERLKSLQVRSKELREEMSRLRKENDLTGFKKAQKELKAVEKEEIALKKSTIDVHKVMKDLNGTSFNDLLRTKKKVEAQMQQFTDRGSEGYNKLKSHLHKLNEEISRTRSEMNSAIPIHEKAGLSISQYAGRVAASVGTVMAFSASFSKASNIILDFDNTFADVKTLLSKDDLAKYGKSLEAGPIDNIAEFGFKIEDVNKSLFDTISASVPASEAIDTMHESAILAVGGVTKLLTATDGLTTVINAWGLSTAESSQVSAAFFSAQKAGKTTVSELASEVGKGAPIFAQAGMSYQEAFSALARLTKGGISTAESVTYLKSAVSSLINPSAEAQKILTKYEIPFGVTGLKAAGFTKVLEKLNEVVKKNPDELAKAITSTEGMAAVSALTGKALDDFKSILSDVNSDFGDNSSLMNAFIEKQNTGTFAIQQAEGALTAYILRFKDHFNPLIIAFFKKVKEGIETLNSFNDWVLRNKESLSVTIKVIGLIITSITSYRLTISAANIVQRVHESLLNASRITATAYAYAKARLTGNTVAANAAMKAMNVTMKTSPLGLIISLVTTAATAYLTFRDSVQDANEEQKEFNTLLEQSKGLMKTSQSTVETGAAMSQMNKRQLENLKASAERDLQTYEDLQIKLNQAREKAKKQEEADKKAAEAEKQANRMNVASAMPGQGGIGATQITFAQERLDQTKTQIVELETALAKFDKFELERIKSSSEQKIAYFNEVEKKEQSAAEKQANLNKQAEESKKRNKEEAAQALKIKEEHLTSLEDLAAATATINQDLANLRVDQNTRELAEIEQKYEEQLRIAREGEEREDDLSAGFAAQRRELELLKNEELIAKKLEQEERFEESKRKIKEQYGIEDLDSAEAIDNAALMDALAQGLIDNEEYEIARLSIAEKYTKLRDDVEKKSIEKKFEAYKKSIEKQQAITALFGDFFSASKEAELEAAGDNEEKKKQIQKKYAIPELAIAASNIISSTAESIMKAVSASPTTLGLPWTAIIGATGLAQLAAVTAQKAKVMGLEDGGFFDVQRAQDGKMFRSTFSARRGYFNRPTVLVGEHNKPEYVVSSAALKNPVIRQMVSFIDLASVNGQIPQLDYQTAIESIPRVRGFETGGYTQPAPAVPDREQSFATQNDIKELLLLVQQSNAANAAAIRNIRVVNNARETDDVISKFKSVENRANLS